MTEFTGGMTQGTTPMDGWDRWGTEEECGYFCVHVHAVIRSFLTLCESSGKYTGLERLWRPQRKTQTPGLRSPDERQNASFPPAASHPDGWPQHPLKSEAEALSAWPSTFFLRQNSSCGQRIILSRS